MLAAPTWLVPAFAAVAIPSAVLWTLGLKRVRFIAAMLLLRVFYRRRRRYKHVVHVHADNDEEEAPVGM